MEKNNELKSEDYPSIFAKDISKTISPPINFKMLTAGSAREPNTRDQSNKKAVQFDTSTYTIPEERTRLNTSHVSESIKSRSCNRSEEGLKNKNINKKRRQISTVKQNSSRRKMIITNNSVSLNRDKSFEQNIAQDDRKSAMFAVNSLDNECGQNSTIFQTLTQTYRGQNRNPNNSKNPRFKISMKFSNFLNTFQTNIQKNRVNAKLILEKLRNRDIKRSVDTQNAYENNQSNNKNAIKNSKLYKNKFAKKLNQIMHNCYNVETEGGKILSKLQLEQDFSKIYNQEFNCTLGLLKDIDFAQGNILDVLYHKKKQEFIEDVELADNVAKEYRSGAVFR